MSFLRHAYILLSTLLRIWILKSQDSKMLKNIFLKIDFNVIIIQLDDTYISL